MNGVICTLTRSRYGGRINKYRFSYSISGIYEPEKKSSMAKDSFTSLGPIPEGEPAEPVKKYSFPSEIQTPISEGWPNVWSAATLGNYTR